MADPLSLLLVPEVRDKFSALRRVINERRDGDYHGPDPRVGHDNAADQAYRARRTEAEREVVDAVLRAERTRLLALTPEGVDVVEGFRGEVARLLVKGGPIGPSTHGADLVVKRIVEAAVAALPVLLAPEVARREQAERERNEWEGRAERQYDEVVAQVARVGAAEAEVARLREALTFYADEKNYRQRAPFEPGDTIVNDDNGDKARATLEAK